MKRQSEVVGSVKGGVKDHGCKTSKMESRGVGVKFQMY